MLNELKIKDSPTVSFLIAKFNTPEDGAEPRLYSFCLCNITSTAISYDTINELMDSCVFEEMEIPSNATEPEVNLYEMRIKNNIARKSRRGVGNVKFTYNGDSYIAYVNQNDDLYFDRPIILYKGKYFKHPQIENLIVKIIRK